MSQTSADQDDLQSPIPLDDDARGFSSGIIAELPRTAWTMHRMMEMAALLTRLMAALEREQMELRANGAFVARPSGTQVANQRGKVVSSLISQVLALRRGLGIDRRSLRGEARDIARRRAQQKSNGIEHDDDLLA